MTRTSPLLSILWILLPIMALSLLGCSAPTIQTPPPATESPKHKTEGRINHVVLFWLKEPNNPARRQEIIRVAQTLRKIPGVLEVRVGEAVPSDREIVDDSFHVGVVLVFASTDDMTFYIHHPRHKRAVRETVRPLVEKVVVYDFVE